MSPIEYHMAYYPSDLIYGQSVNKQQHLTQALSVVHSLTSVA